LEVFYRPAAKFIAAKNSVSRQVITIDLLKPIFPLTYQPDNQYYLAIFICGQVMLKPLRLMENI